jgi:hypothetical protein
MSVETPLAIAVPQSSRFEKRYRPEMWRRNI